MREGLPEPIVLDATVLSNFASVDAFDWLVRSFERPAAVPEVREEIVQGLEHGHAFLRSAVDALSAGHVDEIVPDEPPVGTGVLDLGEAVSLQAAEDHGGTLATDDREARALAKSRGVAVTGSIGVLGRLVRRDDLAVDTADEWLTTWIDEYGYRSPVESVHEVT